MPKATDAQREAFATALREAIRTRAETLVPTVRHDDWLAEQIGLTGQAIRNYLAGVREPKNETVVRQIEKALGCAPNELGQHLGYGPTPSDELARLHRRVDALEEKMDAALAVLEAIGPPSPLAGQGRRRGPRST